VGSNPSTAKNKAKQNNPLQFLNISITSNEIRAVIKIPQQRRAQY
jgi:hypothetical protein